MSEFWTLGYTGAGNDGRAGCRRPTPGNHGLARFDALRRVAAVSMAVAAFASSASAQVVDTSQLEVAGGHQLSRSFRALGLHEWFVSIAGSLDDRSALVGEVAGLSVRQAGRGHVFLIGLRHAWSGRRVTPFVQGLVGGASLGRTFHPFGLVEARPVEVESLFGGHQVGGGIDVRITRRIAARLAANALTLYSDRLEVHGESGSTTRFRFGAGAVLSVPPPDARASGAPSFEVAGGYQGFTSLPRLPFPRGWFVSVGRPLNERVTVVGEVADAYFRDVTPSIFVDEKHWYTYMAGVRYAWPGQRVVPFVQALGGAGTFTSRQEALYEMPPHVRTRTERYVAHQLAGGVDVPITRRTAARFAASSLTLYQGGVSGTILRYSTGLVVRIGSR